MLVWWLSTYLAGVRVSVQIRISFYKTQNHRVSNQKRLTKSGRLGTLPPQLAFLTDMHGPFRRTPTIVKMHLSFISSAINRYVLLVGAGSIVLTVSFVANDQKVEKSSMSQCPLDAGCSTILERFCEAYLMTGILNRSMLCLDFKFFLP
jgi:hypothetical protein